jgi:DnaJ-class molecular chaperone
MSQSRIQFPGVIAIRECCWACHGTGATFASISPLKYRKCAMCMGVGGRGPARRDPRIGDKSAPDVKRKASE